MLVWLVIITLVLLAQPTSSLLELEESYAVQMPYSVFNNKGEITYFDRAVFYMTYDSKREEAIKAAFFPDISSSSIIMNQDIESKTWGVSCSKPIDEKGTPDPSNNCIILSNPVAQTKYRTFTYDYLQAQSLFQFKSNDLKFVPGNALNFNLGQILEFPKWGFGQTGVLALSPSQQNPIWNYLFKTYSFKGNKFVFSFSYKPGVFADRYNPGSTAAFGRSEIFLNGYNREKLGNKGLYYVEQDTDQFFWTLKEVKISTINPDGELSEVMSGKACLTNSFHDLMAAPLDKAMALRKSIAQSMCGKDDCESELKLYNAPDLAISIKLDDGDTVRYRISPETYIYSENESTQVSFGDIDQWRLAGACGEQHTLAFGRLFFLTAYIVFEVEKKGNAKIGLGEILRNARTSESEKAVLSVFIGICIFLLLATGVYKVWNHRRSRTFDRAENSVAIGDYGSLNQPNQTHQEEIPS